MWQAGQYWRKLLFLLKRREFDRDLQEEMRQHAEMKVRRNIAAGMDPVEARYAAQRQLGNTTLQQEESRQNWGFSMLEALIQDIRYGLRGLRKAPGFATVAVLTLALGIGAATAIFSIVNTVLLRPLPYRDSSRLVHIWTVSPMFPEFQMGQSKPDFDELKAHSRSFAALASYQVRNLSLTGVGEPELISVAAVSHGFFGIFEITPQSGRLLEAEDERQKNGDVVLISHALWQRRFGSDPHMVGKAIMLDHKPYTVAGILPDNSSYPAAEAWVPLIISAKEQAMRANWNYFTLGKLRPSASVPSTQSEMDIIAAQLAREYPKEESGIRFKVESLQDVVVDKGAKSELMVLAGAVIFLLLIGCANVSNLVLARGTRREREIAMRAALGASRGRILGQLLIESLLLAFAGGIAGMLLAMASVGAFRALAPLNFARVDEIRLEPVMAAIALAVSSLAGILCGLAPALHTSRRDLTLALKDRAAGSASPQRFSLRNFLVVSEVALALVLLTGSALMARSLFRLMSVNAGFRTDHLLTAPVVLSPSRYPTADAQRLFAQRLLEALRSQPQFTGVALANNAMMDGSAALLSFNPSSIGLNEKNVNAEAKSVSPGFFEAMGISLLHGRGFNERDVKGSPQVVVINESMARRFFAGKDPTGTMIKLGPEPTDGYRIAGVVSDTRDILLSSKPRLQIYFPLLEDTYGSMHVMVRGNADPLLLAGLLRRTVWSVDKDLPVDKIRSMTEIISQSVAQPRFRTWLLGAFAFAGLALTLIGIYGVISYSVSQRTQEIGIRMALGARPENVLRLVLRQGIRLALLGAAIGLGGSLLLTRLLASELYEIKPTDPLTLGAAGVVMLAVSLAASYIPARRATRVDPMVALRCE